MRCVAVFLTLLALTDAFENAKMRERKRKVKEAASYLRIPKFSMDEQRCAACESVAQSIEKKMGMDVHKGGYVEQLALLMSACDGIDAEVTPAELPDPEGNEDSLRKVLHFAPSPKDTGTIERPMPVGLGEYCTTLVEEFEDELVEMIGSAKAIDQEVIRALGSVTSPARYELKEKTCIEITKSCTTESLNKITHARLALVKNMDKSTQAKLVEMFARQAAAGAASPAAVETMAEAMATAAKPQVAAESDSKGGGSGKKWKGKAKKPPTKAPAAAGLPTSPLDAFEWLRETTAQSPYVMLASTSAVVAVTYVGGMVARVW